MSDRSPFTSVTYVLQYIGCIPIRVPIKSLTFNTRTSITRECMHRVYEAVKLKVPTPRPNAKEVAVYIGKISNLQWAMRSVRLHISLDGIVVEDFQTGSILFRHRLPFISFASAGDADMNEFVSFVAKDELANSRQCYVFCCTTTCARDFITSIGQAFSLGYQDFKRSANANQESNVGSFVLQKPAFDNSEPPTIPGGYHPSDEAAGPFSVPKGRVSPKSQGFFDVRSDDLALLLDSVCLNEAWSSPAVSTSANFDEPFNSPTSQPQIPSIQDHHNTFHESRSLLQQEQPQSCKSNTMEPLGEPWYLGKVSRKEAERLLHYDGDFLVRSSSNQNQSNQFVLSGMHNGRLRHLLLVDPLGQIRTRDRIFNSIQELIDYHLSNGTPIRSADSELKLVFPVSQTE